MHGTPSFTGFLNIEQDCAFSAPSGEKPELIIDHLSSSFSLSSELIFLLARFYLIPLLHCSAISAAVFLFS
jgi:hypothetical protein